MSNQIPTFSAEELEARTFLSVAPVAPVAPAQSTPSITLSGSVVTADGTDGADHIGVSVVNQTVTVSVNATSQSYNLNSLTEIDIHGFAGNDTITIGEFSPPVFAGGMNGNDVIADNSAGSNTLYGGALDDSITGGRGSDLIHGGAGNDTLYAGAASASINGNTGNDSINGSGGGNVSLYGGQGSDTLLGATGLSGTDVLTIGPGADSIIPGPRDVIMGQPNGDDTITSPA
jgi:Ca2+-binding RTX toxin-like protein